MDENATSGTRSPSGGSPASELRDYLNVGVLDNSNVTPSELLEYLNADMCQLFAKPFQHEGVWVTWASKLAEMIAAPGPLTLAEVAAIADRLAIALPPAVPTRR